MSREIAAELVGGPYDGQTGWLTVGDEPTARLTFNLEDREAHGTLIIPGEVTVSSRLVAWYDLIVEKPRKIVIVEEVDGHPRARSEVGVRYRYAKGSPCETLFRQADEDALLTAAAHESVMATRRLLLEGKRTHEHT